MATNGTSTLGDATKIAFLEPTRQAPGGLGKLSR